MEEAKCSESIAIYCIIIYAKEEREISFSDPYNRA